MSIIHNLVARFKADTGAFDRNIKKSRTHMTRFGKDMQRVAKQLLAFGGGYLLINRGVRGAVRAFMEQEKAERALMAATNQSISSFKRYASGIQKLTIYGDEQILSQMAYAKNLGVSTEQLEEATTAAIGLAAKYRLDLATSMMLVGRASQGQTQMLTRYGIVLKESLSAQEKFNAVLKIGAEAFHLAEAETETLEGRWEQFANNAGDFAEEIVGAWLDVAKGLGQVIDHYKGVEKSAISAEEAMKRIRESGYQANMPGAFWYPPPTKRPEQIGPRMSWEEKMGLAQIKKDEPFKRQLEDLIRQRKELTPITDKYTKLIDREIALTGRVGEAHWHAAQMIKFENELKEAGITDTIEYNKAIKEMGDKLKDLEKAQRLARIAEDIGDSFANAFEEMIFEAKKFSDVFKSILRDISRSIFKNLITQPMGLAISGAIGDIFGLTPATVAHAGGKVGSIGRKRNVPALAFAGAPRLHGGLAGDEYPAILQRGEQVVPRGGGMSAPTIIINNNTGQRMRQDGQPFFDGNRWVLNIVAEGINRDMTFRKLIASTK